MNNLFKWSFAGQVFDQVTSVNQFACRAIYITDIGAGHNDAAKADILKLHSRFHNRLLLTLVGPFPQ